MNFLARSAARTATRTVPRGLRNVATDASYHARRQAVQEHASGKHGVIFTGFPLQLTYLASTELWRKIRYAETGFCRVFILTTPQLLRRVPFQSVVEFIKYCSC